MEIIIKQVKSRRELKQFVNFEIDLLSRYNAYLPPIIKGELDCFSKKNPSLKYCEYTLFLAYKEDKIVGRVAAIINHRSNEKWGTKKVRFGWFDFIEDINVCKALLNQVIAFGKQNGMSEVHGPMGFTDFDKECWVIAGFEERQNISTLFNPPYYVDYIKTLNYQIGCEWKQYELPASQEIPEKVAKINKLIQEKYKLRISEFKSIKEVLPYADSLFNCLNQTFSHLYGFVALNEEEKKWYVKNFFSLFLPELITFIFDDKDEVVAFGISFPSLNKGLRKANGKLFPLGWYHIWKDLKSYDTIDLMLNGVRPDWQSKGIHSLYYTRMNEIYIKKKIKLAYSNPQIVSNEAVKVWNKYEGREIMHRAIFQKEIST